MGSKGRLGSGYFGWPGGIEDMSAAPTVVVEPVLVAAGESWRVDPLTDDWQHSADAMALKGGGFVLTWLASAPGTGADRVYAQVFGSDGAAIGEPFQVGFSEAGLEELPSVAALEDGGFVIGWTMQNSPQGERVLAQRYDAAGEPTGDLIVLRELVGNSTTPVDLAGLPGGGFVATWSAVYNAQTGEVRARLYDANGALRGDTFQVNTHTIDTQWHPQVAAFADGGFVVTWQSEGQDSAGTSGVYGQRFNAAGIPVGGEFRVNTDTTNNEIRPMVTTWPTAGSSSPGAHSPGILTGRASRHKSTIQAVPR